MEAKVGDRVSMDAKKVGQPRRAGVVRDVSQGLSGVRYQVEWDDGSKTVIAPGAGILLVERGRKAKSQVKEPKKASKNGKKAAKKR